jgi:hypothetical protein
LELEVPCLIHEKEGKQERILMNVKAKVPVNMIILMIIYNLYKYISGISLPPFNPSKLSVYF